MTEDVFSFEPGDPCAGELRLLAKRTATVSVLAACPRLLERLPEHLVEPCQPAVERAVVLREALREVLRAAHPCAMERDREASDVMAGGAIVGLISEPRWSGQRPDQMRQVAMSKRARQLIAATWLGSGNVTTERGMYTYEVLSLNALRLALFAFLRDDVAVRRLARRLKGDQPAPRLSAADPPPQEESPPVADPPLREESHEDAGTATVSDLAIASTETAVATRADRRQGLWRRLDTFATSLVVLATVMGLVVLLRPEVVTVWSQGSGAASGARSAVLADLSSEPWIFCYPGDCGTAVIVVEVQRDAHTGACIASLAVLYESALWRRVLSQDALDRLISTLTRASGCADPAGQAARHHSQQNP